MKTFHSIPIYVSKRTGKNCWQDYRVFPDRIELRCWMILSTFVIPAEEILDIEVRNWNFFSRKNWFSLKLDWADLFQHILLHRKSGLFKYIRFTPDHPEAFAAAVKSIMTGSQ